jgi:ATP-dependent Clp protease ATP-binding subunit ClpB
MATTATGTTTTTRAGVARARRARATATRRTATRVGRGVEDARSDDEASARRRGRAVARASAGAGGSGGKKISQNEFTARAWDAIVRAPEVAKQSKQQIVETEHVCEALCSQKDAFAMRIFAQAGVKDLKLVISRTRDFIAGQPQVSGAAQQVLGRFLESLVDDARTISSGMSDEFVAVEHLVLALARDERFGKGLMADLGITYANLEAAVITLRRGENVTDQDAEDKYEALKKYSRGFDGGGSGGEVGSRHRPRR